jgi:hypothetical protein
MSFRMGFMNEIFSGQERTRHGVHGDEYDQYGRPIPPDAYSRGEPYARPPPPVYICLLLT